MVSKVLFNIVLEITKHKLNIMRTSEKTMHPNTLHYCCNLYLDNCMYEGFKPKDEKIHDLSVKYLFQDSITERERYILIDFFTKTDISYN